jgi:hypothetical protein
VMRASGPGGQTRNDEHQYSEQLHTSIKFDSLVESHKRAFESMDWQWRNIRLR